ncbi:uncharacterized protein LOC121390436 [Gigantopelta aegis]|uniref:uncharacterized protein LOC121390436 n=1 Tax=Gigantopelta aegis TaxID=1735272 RepID=UPI001B88C346|nr:uncharacterized protein LOC121390436 [Gigantopelta aegis]
MRPILVLFCLLLAFGLTAALRITVKGECPEADYQQSLQTCTEIVPNTVEKALVDMTDEERQAVCSYYVDAVMCIQGILNVCEDSPKLMLHGNSMDEMKSLVKEQHRDIEKFCGVTLE